MIEQTENKLFDYAIDALKKLKIKQNSRTAAYNKT